MLTRVQPADATIDRAAARRMFEAVRGFEDPHEEFERILRRVFEIAMRRGDGAIDVGAHVGKHSVPLALSAGPEGWVVAIEPLPWGAERLRGRAQLAGLDDIIEVVNGCAGHEPIEELTFHEVVDHPGWSAKQVREGTTGIVEHRIRQTTVDEVSAGRRTRVIKIDVEGGELDVVLGAKETIERDRPLIHAEVVAGAIVANGWDPGDLFQLFGSHGYEVYDVLGTELLAGDLWSGYVAEPGPVEFFGGFDVVAIHRDDPDRDDVIRCLRTSFGEARLDLSEHGVVELLAPLPPRRIAHDRPADLASDDLAGLPAHAMAQAVKPGPSVWPRGTTLIEPTSIEWGGRSPHLVDLNSATITPLSEPTRVALPVGSGEVGIEDGCTLHVRLSGSFKHVDSRHQTFAEFELGHGMGAGLVRWHRSGAIDCMWIHGTRTLAVRRARRSRLRSLDIELSVIGPVATLRVTGEGFDLTTEAEFPLGVPPMVLTLGRRAHWTSGEPLDATHMSVSGRIAESTPGEEDLRSRIRTTGVAPSFRRALKKAAHTVPGGMVVVRAIRRLLS